MSDECANQAPSTIGDHAMPLGGADELDLRDDVLRRKLVEAGIRAPSGDNCQPWRFRFDNDALEIDLLLDRAKSFFDFRHRGSLLSLGAVVENVRVQAACEGLFVNVSLSNGGVSDVLPRVRLTFQRNALADSQCRARLDAVRDRTVNRRPFLPIAIAAEKKHEWIRDSMKGVHVEIIDNWREMARWARLTCIADRVRWTHPTIHQELFTSIRFSGTEAERMRTGLEIDRLGAGPFAAAIMRWLKPWARMQRLSRYGIDRALANQTRALALSAGALLLVTIDSDEPEQWIRAGEQVQRIWVTAHQQGLCVQPLPVALYLDQRYQAEGIAAFLPQHRPLLEKMRRSLADLLGDRVGAMLCRLGYGWRMRHPAVRLPAESFYDAANVPLKTTT